MKKTVAFVCVTALLFYGCFPAKTATASVASRVPANFDFSPPSKAPVGSTGLTIALIKPVFVKDNPFNYVDPISEMATNMAKDFDELLSAKGFKIRGPFQSIGAMTYSEQQGSDFCFNVEIDLQPHSVDKYTFNQGFSSLGIAPSYKMTGEITFSGSFTIVATSPKGVKLWVKNIALDRSSYSYVGSLKWQNIPTLADQITKDNTVYNIVARQLEKYYNNALDLSWQQIDPREMKDIARQAKEADGKK